MKGLDVAANTYAIIADLENTNLPLSELAIKYDLTPQRISQVYTKALQAGIGVRKRKQGAPGVPRKNKGTIKK